MVSGHDPWTRVCMFHGYNGHLFYPMGWFGGCYRLHWCSTRWGRACFTVYQLYMVMVGTAAWMGPQEVVSLKRKWIGLRGHWRIDSKRCSIGVSPLLSLSSVDAKRVERVPILRLMKIETGRSPRSGHSMALLQRTGGLVDSIGLGIELRIGARTQKRVRWLKDDYGNYWR